MILPADFSPAGSGRPHAFHGCGVGPTNHPGTVDRQADA